MEDFQFGEDLFELDDKRTKCIHCNRPNNVCICHTLPSNKRNLIRSRLTILQHPRELTRPLHTTAILKSCLSVESFKIYRGTRFPAKKFKNLHETVYRDRNILLYPKPGALPINQFNCTAHANPNESLYNIIILDGTWKQAQDMYKRNEFLHNFETAIIDDESESEYVIRTQPDEKCLSTVECAAIALEYFENDPTIREMLLQPLRAMCQFQLDHGQLVHQPRNKR